jgi:Xaa-Pro aminopeptidase
MEAAGIQVLVVTDPMNMNYLTGYDGWSFYVPQVAALALDSDEPIWIGREIDRACARFTAYLRPDNIRCYGDDYVDAPNLHAMAFIAQVLVEQGWGNRRIGVELDAHFFTARCFEELQRGLPGASFVDASRLVNWVRTIKSPREIEFMRQAGQVAEAAMRAGIEAIAPGVRQCDAAAKVYEALIRGTPEYGGDYPDLITMPTGPKSSAPHLTWTDEPYRSGEGTCIELGGCRFRYYAALARTVFLGRPPARMVEMAEVVAEGLDAALDAARSGVRAEEVEAVWRHTIRRTGIEKKSRIGYAIGMGYSPTWIEQTVSLRPGDRTILEPNMTFHMILGMWQDDWGYELSETFRVTDSGPPELFCTFPRHLIVKP